MNLGRLTADDLQTLIILIPQFERIIAEGHAEILAKRNKIFTPQSISSSWHHLYEFPYSEHLRQIIVAFGLNGEVREIETSENPPKAGVAALRDAIKSEGFDWELDDDTRPLLPLIIGLSFSLYLTYKSLLTFGLYLNELLAIVENGGASADKALFNAIKIDPTVVGCNCVSKRVSQAMLEDDQKFLKKLRSAFQGKFTKRENRLYQLQRFVLQILLETGAPKLNSEELYELFVEQLKIATGDRNSDIGDVSNNIRQFAYQFIKQKSVS